MGFSIPAGGITCFSCGADPEQARVSPGTRRLLSDVLTVEAKMLPRLNFTKSDLETARKILPPFCEYQIGRKLRSLRLLYRLQAKGRVVREPVGPSS